VCVNLLCRLYDIDWILYVIWSLVSAAIVRLFAFNKSRAWGLSLKKQKGTIGY
jgi:hypothetical protein